jgi:hypothetical protein
LAASLIAGCRTTPQLHHEVEIGIGTVRPLPPDKSALVRTTAEAAAMTVLTNEFETGWPDDEIAWMDGKCVLLGWLERYPMSFDPRPAPSAVFMVRLVDGAQARATWVLVDATTGEESTSIGNPFGNVRCGA